MYEWNFRHFRSSAYIVVNASARLGTDGKWARGGRLDVALRSILRAEYTSVYKYSTVTYMLGGREHLQVSTRGKKLHTVFTVDRWESHTFHHNFLPNLDLNQSITQPFNQKDFRSSSSVGVS